MTGEYTMLIYCTLSEYDDVMFEIIYHKHKNTVYAIAYKYTKDKVLAEDMTQEAYLRFLKTMGKMQTEDDMKRWLFKIAKNTAINGIKKDSTYKNKIEIWLNDDDYATEFLDKTADKPLDETLKMELAKEVSQALSTLKPIHSDVIRLRYYFGYTVSEIAELTKVPIQTVYSRLNKARALLFDKLSFMKSDYSELFGGVFDEKK